MEAEVPPAAPWLLLSPSGLVYNVSDLTALASLADEVSVPRSNFKQLVGKNKNSSPGLPQEKGGGWQLLQKVWWIQRDSCVYGAAAGPFPFVTANGKEWVQMFKAQHKDSGLDGARLRTLAHKGTVSTFGKREPEYRGWRKVDPPRNALARGLLLSVPKPSSYAVCVHT